MRLKTFIALVALLVLAWPGAAHAKGPSEATIEGDSLDAPIVVGSQDSSTLAEEAGLWLTSFEQTPNYTTAEPPTGDLGESFLVTWTLVFEEGQEFDVRMTLYPYAEGGPLAYNEPGQPIFDTVTPGGWVHARARLPQTLERLGVTKDASPAPAATTTPAPRSDTTRNWWPVGIVLAVAAAGLGGLFVARRRVQMSHA